MRVEPWRPRVEWRSASSRRGGGGRGKCRFRLIVDTEHRSSETTGYLDSILKVQPRRPWSPP